MEYKSRVFMENSWSSFGMKALKIISLRKNYDNTFNNSHKRRYKIQLILPEILDSEEEDSVLPVWSLLLSLCQKSLLFKFLKSNEICAYGKACRDKGNSVETLEGLVLTLLITE